MYIIECICEFVVALAMLLYDLACKVVAAAPYVLIYCIGMLGLAIAAKVSWAILWAVI